MALRSLTLLFAIILTASTAQAAIITNDVSFSRISSNATENVESLISASVIGDTADPNKVLFIIELGTSTLSDPRITDIFFEDGVLNSILQLGDANSDITFASFIEDTGVNYTTPSNHDNLPSANDASPDFVSGGDLFSAEPVNPQNSNSINEGEFLGILFLLDAGKTYDDLINQMIAGQSRIGVHVQGIGNESDAFVSDPPTIITNTVPEPASMIIWGSGLACVALGRRALNRKKRQS